MQQITIKLPDSTIDLLEEIAHEEYDDNRSDAIRAVLAKGMDYDALEARHDDLQRQLAAVNSRQEDVTELVEYVEEQRDLTQYQERRQRLLDNSNILTRWKWKVTGVPVESTDNPSAD